MNKKILSLAALCFSLGACVSPPPPAFQEARPEFSPLVFSAAQHTALANDQLAPASYGVEAPSAPLWDTSRYEAVPNSSVPEVAIAAAPSGVAGPAYGGPSYSAASISPSYSQSSSGTYAGNCMYPDDLDSAGRRCGARSAYSRPGGYEPAYRPNSTYSALGSGGTTRVRGYYRKDGTYVRSHTRRRR